MRTYTIPIYFGCKNIGKYFDVRGMIIRKDVDDAIYRAKTYIDSGADGIMIHSKTNDFTQILSFCDKFKDVKKKVPLVVVPSTYNKVKEEELIKAGVDIVIYANHLLRSSYPAMVNTAKSILQNKRCYEASVGCLPIKKVLELIPNE